MFPKIERIAFIGKAISIDYFSFKTSGVIVVYYITAS